MSNDARRLGRRTVLVAAWSIPVVTLAAPAPVVAASQPATVTTTTVTGTDPSTITDPQLKAIVDAELAKIPANEQNKAIVVLMPVSGGSMLYLDRAEAVTGNDNSTWIGIPGSYPIVHTPTFDGGVAVPVKSNRAPGIYRVYYRIDGGPEQSILLNYRTD